MSATPQVPAPGAPTGLSLTAGDKQVTATWQAVTGATGYTLYYSQSSLGADLTGVTSVSIDSGTTTVGTVTGLNNGTLYYFAVSATNAGGESPASAQDSATPQVPTPGAPTGLSLAAGDKQVTVNWSGVSGASSYILYYRATNSLATLNDAKLDDTSDTSITRVTISSGTSRTVDGLTNGTPYYFRVKAVNAGGRSAASSEVLRHAASSRAGCAGWSQPQRRVTQQVTRKLGPAVTGASRLHALLLYNRSWSRTTSPGPNRYGGAQSHRATTHGHCHRVDQRHHLYHFASSRQANDRRSRAAASSEASATPQVPAPGAPGGSQPHGW